VRARDAGIGAALTALSAWLFGLAFPPVSWRPLAWVALAPFLVAVARGSLGRAVALTWLWCLAAAWAVGDWFPRSVASYFEQPMPIAAALFFAVFTLMAAPYYLGAVLAWRHLHARFALALPLLAACAWVAAELGRGRLLSGTALFVGNPWGLLGYSHSGALSFAQIASWTGVYGISFALACPNAALAQVVLCWPERERRLRALAALPLALLPALAAIGYGRVALATAHERERVEPIEIAIVQGHVAQESQWRSDDYGRNLETYLQLTAAAANRSQIAIAFWPESAMTFFLEREPLYRRAIAAFLQPRDLELVAGGPRIVGDDASALYSNSVYVLRPNGAEAARYDKEFLLPFAEYFPIGIDVLRRNFGRIREFTPGVAVAPIPTRAGPAGVLLCNEAMLPEVAGERVAAGAAYLANPTNDSWISDAKYTEQQFDIARMRAIEQRRWLVRASTSGPSAVIDPWGRVAARAKPLERATISARIWPRSERTVYSRWGDGFAFACVASVALALLTRPGTRA
jgi:apolipoprotein N-acyltransferase